MITLQVREALNIVDKIIGLIGKKDFQPLLIRTRFGIHTVGMRVPIDVMILDNKNKVVSFRKNLSQNKLFFWNPKYNTVIELPFGFIEKKKIAIGQRINIEFIRPI